FTSLAKSIVFQQLHGKAATTIWNRLVEEIHPTTQTILTPTMFHAFSIEQLKPFGLSGQKASYLISLSRFFSLPSTMTLLSPTSLSTLSNDEIKKELIKVKGIGGWTVDMFLMFCLKRLDVLPVGDLGVKKGMGLFFGCEAECPKKKKSNGKTKLMSDSEMYERTEHWKPFRSVGSWYMWRLIEI
ncbi:DNA glycosylase, partial [Paraphysoderma sedebokerense]